MTAIKDNPLIALMCLCALICTTCGFVGAAVINKSLERTEENRGNIIRNSEKISNMSGSILAILRNQEKGNDALIMLQIQTSEINATLKQLELVE